MSDFTKMLGAKMREARRRHNLTQAQVAESLNVPAEVYGRMERGSMCPRLELLVALCHTLGTTPDHLLGFAHYRARPVGGVA